MNGTERKNIRVGAKVKIVQKQHQRTGQLTEGVVKDILTNSAVHHRGIKVRLENGTIGRVQEVCGEEMRRQD
ncbi:MAG: YwbE family protein [Heliobacteriaceae bacterium]|nr:YwbE family protein [Heliobacteriaceae bacterium]